MTRRYFGTDGIRGRVGDAVINPMFMLQLGWAIGTVLLDDQHKTVLIGRDTRISGTSLEAALQAGLAAAGADVRTLGVIRSALNDGIVRLFIGDTAVNA